jgi:flavin reductase (DIM6/NTAB) family NADH-FMN oxidoreductase RutF
MVGEDMETTIPAIDAVLSGADMEQKDKIGKAIGRIASGVFIVTAQKGGKSEGLLASWVNQAAFNPPMIMAAVKKERHILEMLSKGSKFSLNVLSKTNMDIFKNFVKPHEPGLDRFAGLNMLETQKHAPVFADAVAYLDCVTVSLTEAGDHLVVLGEIVGGDLLQAEADPMVHLRKNGFHY